MRKSIILIIILLNISTLFAGNHFSIKYGINYSTFYNDNNSSFLRGYSIGINYKYSFFKYYFIGTGLYYSKIGGKLKNKILKGNSWPPGSKNPVIVSNVDIFAIVGYIKLPLYLGYSFHFNKNLKIEFSGGYTILIPSKDNVYDKVNYIIGEFESEEIHKYDYESVGYDESVFPTGDYSHSLLDFGAGFVYKKYCVDLTTHFQLGDFGTFDNISKIKRSLFTIEILFGLEF